MKCQNCGTKDANVRYMQNINGDKTELHLCSECARQMNIGIDFTFNSHFESVFSNFFREFNGKMKLLDDMAMHCDNCGRTYSDYVDSDVIGCSNCNSIFGKINEGENILKKEKCNPEEEKLKKLEEEMQECIKVENYEKAAMLRDEIKKIKKDIETEKN